MFILFLFSSDRLLLRTARIIEKKAKKINPKENPIADKDSERMGLKERVDSIPLSNVVREAFLSWNMIRNKYLHGEIQSFDKKQFFEDYRLVNQTFNAILFLGKTKFLNRVWLFLENHASLFVNAASISEQLITQTARILEKKAKKLNPTKNDENGKPLSIGKRIQSINGFTEKERNSFKYWSIQRNKYVHGEVDNIQRKRFLGNYRAANQALNRLILYEYGNTLQKLQYFAICFINGLYYTFSDLIVTLFIFLLRMFGALAIRIIGLALGAGLVWLLAVILLFVLAMIYQYYYPDAGIIRYGK